MISSVETENNRVQKTNTREGEETLPHNSLRLSSEGRTVDALAPRADEGRNKHRNALGSCK